MAKLDMHLPSFEDTVLSTQAQRDMANGERITKIPINNIKAFEGHPFSVTMDEDMTRLIDSIRNSGMNTPAIVRPAKDGNGYEMIAGHRRKFALEKLGITDMDCIVRNIDDDEAVIQMVDSNVQRENIKPTERGYAYKMRLDAMKHQGKAIPDYNEDVGIEYDKDTSSQIETKFKKGLRSDELLAIQLGMDRNKIQRFIRLTYLIKPLQQMVDKEHPDELTIAFNPAVILSYLKEDEQQMLCDLMLEKMATPNISQCQEFKEHSKNGTLTYEFMDRTLSEEKPNQKESITFKHSDSKKFFPGDFTPREIKQQMLRNLEKWSQSEDYEKDIAAIRKARNKGLER